jgi:hypothetical protein
MEKVRDFLVEVIKAIVDEPEAVNAEVKRDDMGVLLTLHVSATDVGKVIGRQGNTAKALRTILRVVGMKEKARINLKIAEPEGGRQDYRDNNLSL